MPRRGPIDIPLRLADNCKTAPSLSTIKTIAIEKTPYTTTDILIIFAVAASDKSGKNGLMKSSSVTAANEFKPVDSELNAALNIPAVKSS